MHIGYNITYVVHGHSARVQSINLLHLCLHDIVVPQTSSQLQILQPRNITRGEHENLVFIPCPFIRRDLAPSIWRINETDYTSATLPSIFIWSRDGLFIKEVHRCLNQTSFQCIDTSDSGFRERKSDVGTLKVTITSGEGCTSKCTIVLSTHWHRFYAVSRVPANLCINLYCHMQEGAGTRAT